MAFTTHVAWAMHQLQQQQRKQKRQQQSKERGEEGKSENVGDGEQIEQEVAIPRGASEVWDALPQFWAALACVGSRCSSQHAHTTQNGQQAAATTAAAAVSASEQPPPVKHTSTAPPHPPISLQALDALESCVHTLVAVSADVSTPWQPPTSAVNHSRKSNSKNSKGSAAGGPAAWCSFHAAATATALLARHALSPLTEDSPSSHHQQHSTQQPTVPTTQHQHNAHQLKSTADTPSSSYHQHSTPLNHIHSTHTRLLAAAEQLLAVTSTPKQELFTDHFGHIKTAPSSASLTPTDADTSAAFPHASNAVAAEWQAGAAWTAESLAHIVRATQFDGCHAEPGAHASSDGMSSSNVSSSLHRSSVSTCNSQQTASPASTKQQTQQQQEGQQQVQQQSVGRSGLVVEVVDLSADASNENTTAYDSVSSGGGTPVRMGGRKSVVADESVQEQQQSNGPSAHGSHTAATATQQASTQRHAAIVRGALLMWAAYAPHEQLSSTPWAQALSQQFVQQQAQQSFKQQSQQQQSQSQQHHHQAAADTLTFTPTSDPYPALLSALSSLPPSLLSSLAHATSSSTEAVRSSKISHKKGADTHSPNSDTAAAEQHLLVTAVEAFVPDLRRTVAASPDLLNPQVRIE